MSKIGGIAKFRQIFRGNLLKNWKSKNVMSTCCPQEPAPECCEVKSLFDEATVPEGDWHEHAKKRNDRYNKILIFGLVNFLISGFCVNKYGMHKNYPDFKFKA